MISMAGMGEKDIYFLFVVYCLVFIVCERFRVAGSTFFICYSLFVIFYLPILEFGICKSGIFDLHIQKISQYPLPNIRTFFRMKLYSVKIIAMKCTAEG